MALRTAADILRDNRLWDALNPPVKSSTPTTSVTSPPLYVPRGPIVSRPPTTPINYDPFAPPASDWTLSGGLSDVTPSDDTHSDTAAEGRAALSFMGHPASFLGGKAGEAIGGKAGATIGSIAGNLAGKAIGVVNPLSFVTDFISAIIGLGMRGNDSADATFTTHNAYGPDGSVSGNSGLAFGTANPGDFTGITSAGVDPSYAVAPTGEGGFASNDTSTAPGTFSDPGVSSLGDVGLPGGDSSYGNGDATGGLGYSDSANYGGDGGGGNGGGDGGGSVICTELHRQGILPADIYAIDSAWGRTLPKAVMVGYQAWAVPVARHMARSRAFTAFVWLIARPVITKGMVHRMRPDTPGSWLGEMMLRFGLEVCSEAGRRILFDRGVKA